MPFVSAIACRHFVVFLSALLVLSGCAGLTVSDPRNRYYEQALERIFITNRMPATEIRVEYVATPGDARTLAEKLVDEAIIYEKDVTGKLVYEKIKDRPKFPQMRDKLIKDVVSEPALLEPGDRMVKIRIAPENRPVYEMFGLAYADGTPKLDPIYSKHVGVSWPRAATKKGSWDYKYQVDWNNGLGTRKITNGIEAKIDTSQCHINNYSARPVFILHDSINIDGDCTEAVVTAYTKANPACGGHAHVPGQEDCIHFVTYCKSIFGLGAGNNLELKVGAGFTTTIQTSMGPITLNGSFAIDETWLTQIYEDVYEGRLCACIGNPFASSATADGKTQFEALRYGTATTTEVINPREPRNFCAAPEVRPSGVGTFGAGEKTDAKPEISKPLGGTH